MSKPNLFRDSLMALSLGLTMGCDSSDERLAEYAHASVQQQIQQNERIARQSQDVTQQSRQIADAAKQLVEADSRARQELITAQKTLHQGLQAERAGIDRQRETLERERRQLSEERHRDPIIAETIYQVGVIFACVLPLVGALYTLRLLLTDSGDANALNELLVTELIAETPNGLPPPAPDAAIFLSHDEPPAPDPEGIAHPTSDGPPPF